MNRKITAVAVSGLAVAMLRAGLYQVALDEKNLLTPFHPLELLLWAVTAVAVAGVAWWVWKEAAATEETIPSGMAAALGCFALAAGIAPELLSLGTGPMGLMEKLCMILGVAAAAGMVLAGLARLRGKMPFFGIHEVLCAWISLRLVVAYRIWSADPQIMDYVLPMLANVCLGLFAYQLAAWEVGSCRRRGLWGWGLLAVFFCAASLGSAGSLFYVAGGIWGLTTLCRFPGKET